MKQPNYSGEKIGEMIHLKDVLSHFDDFLIKHPVVWIVGGIANHGKTKGDIDVLINVPPEESDSTLARVIRFRIQRSLPKKYWHRLHWLYNDGAGPFTSHVPLFTLRANKTDLKTVEMSAAASIRPLHFFKPPKPKKGRYKKETFSIPALLQVIPEDAYPVEVNEKYDGMRAEFHKKGSEVKIWSEDGGDVTDRFPTMVEQLKRYPKDIVLDTEITGSYKGKHIGRSDVSGYAHKKDKPDDALYTANVHDKVYWDGIDMHTWPRWKRMDLLQKTKIGSKFNIIPFKIAKDPEELAKAVRYFEKIPGSEGAMIKREDSDYELDGFTTKWWKYKKDFVINARVVEKNKAGDAWNYLCTIGKNIPVGRTYNTSFDAQKGDILQVAFGNLNKYLDGEKAWYNWVFPRVLGIQEDRSNPDDTIQADLLNKESGGFIENKPWPERFKQYLSVEDLIKNIDTYNPKAANNRQLLDDHRITHAWASTIFTGKKLKYNIHQVKKLHDEIVKEMESRGFSHNTPIELTTEAKRKLLDYRRLMNKPIDEALWTAYDEYIDLSRKLRFVYQHHWRGKSLHGDLRFEQPDKKQLEGYTLAIEMPGTIKEPIDSLEKSRKVSKQPIYKIDYKTGTQRDQKILVFTKAPQPLVWLEEQGKVSKAEPGEPPSIGATRNFPGVFDIIDKGYYEPGADKPFFKEYFIEGNVFKGRYVARKLPSTQRFKDTGKEPFVWYFWKPDDQVPYILSTRAIRKQDFPLDKSWMPSSVEKKIPEELRWWQKDLNRQEATEMLREIRKLKIYQNLSSSQEGLYKTWRSLVNMSAEELKNFKESPEGKDAGLTKEEADKQGIKSGNESAEWILKMKPVGRTYPEAVKNWTPEMWDWCKRQVSFIKRMLGVEGPLYDAGKMTRKLKALKIWGHDPEKKSESSSIKKFILDRHWWKGQEVIRNLPVEHWDLRFPDFEFQLDKNPASGSTKINAVRSEEHDVPDKALSDKEDMIIPPGEKGNPNKKIDAHVETLDKGTVDIIASSENFITADFSGKHLKGNYTFKRVDPGSSQWLVTKGRDSQEMSSMLDEFEIEQIIDLSDPQLRNSRPDIARIVGCSSSAVYAWQKRAGLN